MKSNEGENRNKKNFFFRRQVFIELKCNRWKSGPHPKLKGYLWWISIWLIFKIWDFESKKKKSLNFSLERRGVSWQDLVWGPMVGHTGLGQETLGPFRQPPAGLGKNGGLSSCVPTPFCGDGDFRKDANSVKYIWRWRRFDISHHRHRVWEVLFF